MSEALKPLKWYKKLADKRERLAAGAFLVEGPRATAQVVTSAPDAIIELLSVEQPSELHSRYPTRLITDAQLKSISTAQHPQGPIAVVRMPAGIYSSNLPEEVGRKLLLLEDVQDPGNVGTLIRTAAAFNFDGIVLSSKCADPLSPKCVQASAGTVLSLWMRVTGDYVPLADELKGRGYTLAAADLSGADDVSQLRADKLLLALGNEAGGLSSAVLDIASYRLRIAINRDKAESLNVAACGAVCMYLGSGGF